MSRLGLESRFTDTMTKWSFYCLIFFRSKSNEKLFTSLAWPRYNWNFHNRVTLFKLQTCLWNKFSLKLTKCEILTHCFLIYSLKGLHKLNSKKKKIHIHSTLLNVLWFPRNFLIRLESASIYGGRMKSFCKRKHWFFWIHGKANVCQYAAESIGPQ